MPLVPDSTFKEFKAVDGPVGYYCTCKRMNQGVNSFFEYCETYNKQPNIALLTLFLGFTSRSQRRNFLEKTKKCQPAWSRAKLLIESHHNNNLTDPNTKNAQGSKFYLAAAFKYSEKHEISADISSTVVRLPAKKQPGAETKVQMRKRQSASKRKK